MVDGISSSLAGIRDATDRISRAAQNISRASVPPKAGETPVNLDQEVVNTAISSVAYKANAKVLKSQLDTEKRLLDILA